MEKKTAREIFESMRSEAKEYEMKSLDDKPNEAGIYTINIEGVRSVRPMTIEFDGVNWDKKGVESALKDAGGDINKIVYYGDEIIPKNKNKNKIMKKTNIPECFPYNGETCFSKGSTNLNDYIHGGFEDESRDKEASIVLKKLIEKYGNPECGRNRATFISKKCVIKFPLNDDGELNNLAEGNFISENTAKGKIINVNNFNCVVQEKLCLNLTDTNELPEWTKHIDSNQIGFDIKGKLKAYDFAEDVNKLMEKTNKSDKKKKM